MRLCPILPYVSLITVCAFFASIQVSVTTESLLSETDTNDQVCSNTPDENHHHHIQDVLYTDDEPYTTCRYYLAPSSLPNAGLGIFSGANLTAGTTTPPDIVIHSVTADQLINYRCGYVDSLRDYCLKRYPKWLLKNYRWNSESITYQHEQVDANIPGMGALPNAHLSRDLIAASISPPTVENLGMHRSIDPGAGASSQYALQFVFKNDVEKGREIFISYGEEYFDSPSNSHMKVPYQGDYKIVNDLSEMLTTLFPQTLNDTVKDQKTLKNVKVSQDTLALVKDLLSQNAYFKSIAASSIHELQLIREVGSARASIPNLVRSSHWLQSNGRCLDEIRMEKSTINQAGRGAFARRFLSRGEIVATSPLLQIDKRLLEPLTERDPQVGAAIWEALARPLLFNYCWGHSHSNVLLFPYSSLVNYINHGKEEVANVELRWSTMDGHQEEWLRLPADKILFKQRAGLVMEFVAKRNIQEGEEILVNYGSIWEEAWDNHISSWIPPIRSELYISAATMNSQDNHIHLRTLREREIDPYPDNIHLYCLLPDDFFINAEKSNDPSQEDEYTWWYPDSTNETDTFTASKSTDRRECEILDRIKLKSCLESEGDYFLYKVTMKSKSHFDKMPHDVSLVVTDVPRAAIQFADKPYTLDEFMKGTFREHMYLPDEMFPDAWID